MTDAHLTEADRGQRRRPSRQPVMPNQAVEPLPQITRMSSTVRLMIHCAGMSH
jgi:hypothetical protein